MELDKAICNLFYSANAKEMFSFTSLQGPTVIYPRGGSTKYAFLDILIGVIRSSINPRTDCINWVEAVGLFLYSETSPGNNSRRVFPTPRVRLSELIKVNKLAFREITVVLRIKPFRLPARQPVVSCSSRPMVLEVTRFRQWTLQRAQVATWKSRTPEYCYSFFCILHLPFSIYKHKCP